MLKYCLYNNHLTGNEDYIAVPQEVESLSIEDIIKQITGPGSILKQTECRAVIYAFLDQVAQNTAAGKGMTSPYLIVSPGISGVFVDTEDKFDPSRHQKHLNIKPGKELRKCLQKMPLEKINSPIRRPTIHNVFDMKSGVTNEKITSGHIIEIQGSNLKIGDINDKNQGVFLENITNNKTTRIKNIYTNQPKKITALLPERLRKGSYTLIVKTIYRGCKNVKEGHLDQVLAIK